MDGRARDERLELLWAEREIRRAIESACEGTDRRDVGLLRSVYHLDSTDDHGAFTGTGHEFAEHIVKALPGAGFTATAHHITNCRIEVEGTGDGGEARASSYFLGTAMKGGERGRPVTFIVGRYQDVLTRRDGCWRISARTVIVDLQTTVAQP